MSIVVAVAAMLLAGGTRAGADDARASAASAASAPANRRPDAVVDGHDWGAVQVVVYKRARRLAVYRRAVFEKEFRVVLGRNPDGPKRHEGDARTPEGLYHVTERREHARWQYFLALDYPGDRDRESYDEALARGEIPVENGHPRGIGHSIGIHGNDREQQQADGVDWTQGCIALDAADATELAETVGVGTPVWIVK